MVVEVGGGKSDDVDFEVWGVFLGLGAGFDGAGVVFAGTDADPELTARPENSWEAKLACFSFSFACCGWVEVIGFSTRGLLVSEGTGIGVAAVVGFIVLEILRKRKKSISKGFNRRRERFIPFPYESLTGPHRILYFELLRAEGEEREKSE